MANYFFLNNEKHQAIDPKISETAKQDISQNKPKPNQNQNTNKKAPPIDTTYSNS